MMVWLNLKRFFIGCFFVILIAGCATTGEETFTPEPSPTLEPATSTPVAPTSSPEPISCEKVEGNCLELHFDGESCTNQGPTNFKAGPFTLIFFNESELVANLAVIRLRDGKTIQDLRDYNGEEPSPVHSPGWASEQGAWLGESDLIMPGEIYIWDGFLAPGLHATSCVRSEPHGVWLGGGFTVEE